MATSSIRSEWIDLRVGDGTRMRAWVAQPRGQSPRRGLLVFQEAFGVNAHIRSVTERLAAAGFVAISPELFHRTASGFDGRYDDSPTAMAQLQQVTIEGIDADVRAAYEWLEGAGVAGRAAAVGYCFGGRVAFVANSSLPLKAAASYYGGRIPPLLDRTPRLSGPMLFFWGGLDHHVPSEQRQAVIAGLGDAGKTFVDVVFSNADHGFFNEDRPSYHEQSAIQSWNLTLSFLNTYCPE